MEILNKIKLLSEAANSISSEDGYNFRLQYSVITGAWNLVVEHFYRGKTLSHPGPALFDKVLTDTNLDELLSELKNKLVTRAKDLSDIKQRECDKLYEDLKKISSSFAKSVAVTESLQKL